MSHIEILDTRTESTVAAQTRKIGQRRGPHRTRSPLRAGPTPGQAAATLIMVHGRGGSAEDMLSLYSDLGLQRFAALAPQADRNIWYPKSSLAPLEANQPYLDGALKSLESLVRKLLAKGISSERIAFLGFSQGACLILEYSARYPRKYGAIIGLKGGLIGPSRTVRNYQGSLMGTPIFLVANDPDPHVPFERVQETQTVLTMMGGVVDLRCYQGMPHTINEDELEAARTLLERLGPD